MTDFIIRKIPADLWRRAKHVAVDLGISLQKLVIRAVEEFVECEERKKEMKIKKS